MPHRASSCSEWQHMHRKIRRPITSKSKLHNSSAFDINHMTYSSHFFCLSFFISLCGSIYGRLYSFFLVQFFLVPIYILNLVIVCSSSHHPGHLFFNIRTWNVISQLLCEGKDKSTKTTIYMQSNSMSNRNLAEGRNGINHTLWGQKQKQVTWERIHDK